MVAAGLRRRVGARAHVDDALLLPSQQVCRERVATRAGHGCTDDDAALAVHGEFARAEVDERHVLRDLPGGPDDVAAAVLERSAAGVLRWPLPSRG